MRSDSLPGGQERSFVEEARRRQLVEAAIEVLAGRGYGQASLARVAECAGVSKGVVSYHFAGKDELMEQVVLHVFAMAGDALAERMGAEGTARGMLRAYVLGQAAVMRERPAHVRAFGQVVSTMRTADGELRFGARTSEPVFRGLEEVFRLGQDGGEFRDFDGRAMAVTVQGALDAMAAYWFTHPEHDLEAHARELAELFDRATRADPAAENPS